MADVIVQCFGEDNDIIQIDQAVLPLESREDDVECSLECGGSVGQAEWHADIL